MDDNVFAYAFEPEHFALLQRVERGLHGDGTHLTSDARRDLANLMSLVLGHAVKMTRDEFEYGERHPAHNRIKEVK